MSLNFNYLLHNEIQNDILINIDDKDILKLRNLYKNYNWPYAAQAYYFVNQLLDWKQKDPKTGVRFTCPEGKWQDGTFVAIVTECTYNIYFFTLEKSCERLCKALKQTKLIDWDKGPYICAVHEHQDGPIMAILRGINTIEFEIESSCWWISKEKAINFEITCPSDVTILPLNPKHATTINSLWPHSFVNSDLYLANLIQCNGGFGIFSNQTQELCSWIMTNDFGAIAILQTVEKHKRKGYGAILTKLLAKQNAEKNSDSITYIVRKNIISQTLFKSLGFELINYVRWVQYKQKRSRLIYKL